MNKIAIIGANEYQRRLIRKAIEMKLEVHVFSWLHDRKHINSDISFHEVDVRMIDKILSICKSVDIDGVCSISSDLTNITVNYICNKLSLPSNPPNVLRLTTNKYLMREELLNNNAPVPLFSSNKDNINFNFPMIVKPTDRSGSRGVTKVTSKSDLSEAIKRSSQESFSNEIIIEEYIEGREYSVESFTLDGKHNILQVTEKFTTNAPNFIERGHLSPARINNEIKEKIFNVIKKSLNILGIITGPAHSEIRINNQGDIKIIEIASRIGGDFIGSDLVINSTGIDYLQLEIKRSLSINIDKSELQQKSLNNIMSYFFFSNEDQLNFNNIRHIVKLIDYKIINKPKLKVTDSSHRFGYAVFEVNTSDIELVIKKLNLDKN
ncbi:ATP-grasp domain-containing protein [Vibrio sp. 03-59-1]|uniref:ATP-grasp domain-containing protein n=1 Tax=Vibrio sp. 03-59-1 TaxID=2607607 RepID=UPI0014939781|nr:ATP-grasp domain-containing protein [Vibrio sp. 03-59-1]NOH84742.1 ATP-grasp domain-containing protein [Vibrio sp. 03-59-1]